jgi:hypothetical protein
MLHALSLEKPRDDSPPAATTLVFSAKIFLTEQS